MCRSTKHALRYDKYRYEQEKKKKESLKKSREGSSKLKEVKVSYKIGEHDYDVMRRRALKSSAMLPLPTAEHVGSR